MLLDVKTSILWKHASGQVRRLVGVVGVYGSRLDEIEIKFSGWLQILPGGP